jgi:hypothetical protein
LVVFCAVPAYRHPVSKKIMDEQYSDEEASRRMNEALRRALNTPPTPQATVRHPRQRKKSGAARRPAKSRTSAR